MLPPTLVSGWVCPTGSTSGDLIMGREWVFSTYSSSFLFLEFPLIDFVQFVEGHNSFV